MASVSVRRLRDHLQALEDDGWLAITGSQYLLNVDRIRREAGERSRELAQVLAPDEPME